MSNKADFVRFAQSDFVGALLLRQIGPLSVRLSETRLDEIERWIEKENLPLERGDVVRSAREMDKLGLVRFVVGRRGASSRIEWLFDTSELGEADISEPLGFADEIGRRDAIENEQHNKLDGVIEHSFRVRADFPVTFALPADFSAGEAERFCAFIKSLPF